MRIRGMDRVKFFILQADKLMKGALENVVEKWRNASVVDLALMSNTDLPPPGTGTADDDDADEDELDSDSEGECFVSKCFGLHSEVTRSFLTSFCRRRGMMMMMMMVVVLVMTLPMKTRILWNVLMHLGTNTGSGGGITGRSCYVTM